MQGERPTMVETEPARRVTGPHPERCQLTCFFSQAGSLLPWKHSLRFGILGIGGNGVALTILKEQNLSEITKRKLCTRERKPCQNKLKPHSAQAAGPCANSNQGPHRNPWDRRRVRTTLGLCLLVCRKVMGDKEEICKALPAVLMPLPLLDKH